MIACTCPKRDHAHKSHKASTVFHWSYDNGKISKDGIVSFNLPAFKSADGFAVCPQASTCALVCYARQGHYVIPRVSTPREHNLAMVRAALDDNTLIDTLVADIESLHMAWTRIRIHDSGDFFEERYLRAWAEVARRTPWMQYYAYSKMIALLNVLRPELPPNLHIVQSAGGKQDALMDLGYAHAVIFSSEQAMMEAGYANGTHSDKPAYSGVVKVGLVYHGSTKLSAHKRELLDKVSDQVQVQELVATLA